METRKTTVELVELKNGSTIVLSNCHFTHFVSGKVLAGQTESGATRAIAVEDIVRHVAMGLDDDGNLVESDDIPFSLRRQHWG